MDHYLRDVVEEPRYSQDFDRLRYHYPALDAIQALLSWELSTTPAIGTPLEQAPDFRIYTTKALGDTPAFHVLYTFDEQKVYLHSIKAVS